MSHFRYSMYLLTASLICGTANADSLSVIPTEFSIAGSRQQVQLVVRLAADLKPKAVTLQRESVDVTRAATYSSSDQKVATVSKTGVVRPVANGTAVITAQMGDQKARATISVTDIGENHPISFDHDMLPVLARTGCSGGACHGSPHGKAGFRLSLFGGDPEFDRRALVRESRSRRVSLLNPENSMLLLKPTMQLPHMGGRRFSAGDSDYQILRDWIAEGCSVKKPNVECVGIDVFPDERQVLQLPDAVQQLRVTARFADGTARDVTHLSKFDSSDIGIAHVSGNGYVQGHSRGDIAVIVKYLNFIATPLMTFVRDVKGFEWHSPGVVNFVDEHVDQKLRQMKYLPAEECSDEVFLRRVYLDVIGILPAPDERRRFLDSSSTAKRSELIEELLLRPEYARFWAQKWGDLLRVSRKQIGLASVFKYSQWLQSAIVSNKPYDQFAREILTASGSTEQNPAANYFRTAADTNDAMETSAQLFLGTRIQCAKCHNHPFERWTQDNYYGLAAVFHRVGRKKTGPKSEDVIVFDLPTGDVNHPTTGNAALPWVPGIGVLEVASQHGRREAFVDWLISQDNPFLAKVEVNRIWAQLMGRGIVEPFDDFRDSNPPSNPGLLEALADDFQKHGFDRNHILRTILNSRTYQASSKANRFNVADFRYFSHYRPRRLSAEQIVDALSAVTGLDEMFTGVPTGTKATWLPAPDLKPHDRNELGKVDFLKVFGQPERQSVCECERGDDTSLGQALQLLNGEFLNRRLTSPDSRFRKMLASKASHDTIVRELFLHGLCREPTMEEMQSAVGHAEKHKDANAAFEDICWAIVNKHEFLFQH